ncbi:hypothetical protein EJ06DRAFT_519484 [Trichodelitschia bisporula]|uniref:HTH APSES-type domain-containing protein n=1 Tax=Trichodelitschia bisporula TaxID=703511 RepID=A0A6G1I683_9PEZI|nr:hypothetical protein EJ06DRAFT_519484 [Trichodelitschia bisporula]
MKIAALLNPPPPPPPSPAEWRPRGTVVPNHHSALRAPQPTYAPTPPKRVAKQPKDAPIFRKGATKGAVLFPPYEAAPGSELAARHAEFSVYPRGEIADYCHHIPYSSDKKTFLTKTGRDAFEVFQYTFKIPGEDKEYTVMWDYNVGLVRITPFFKCCKYSKAPKVLNLNPGLREISHSITGGALAAQGYWMPYACALAVARTFCHPIRHALTPVFGPSFAETCIPPSDPRFASFKIDPAIIRHCTAETARWLARADARPGPGPLGPDPRMLDPEPLALGLPSPASPPPTWRFKPLQPAPRRARGPEEAESGYGTDTDWSSGGAGSPGVSPRTVPAGPPWSEPRGDVHGSRTPRFAPPTWAAVNLAPLGQSGPLGHGPPFGRTLESVATGRLLPPAPAPRRERDRGDEMQERGLGLVESDGGTVLGRRGNGRGS